MTGTEFLNFEGQPAEMCEPLAPFHMSAQIPPLTHMQNQVDQLSPVVRQVGAMNLKFEWIKREEPCPPQEEEFSGNGCPGKPVAYFQWAPEDQLSFPSNVPVAAQQQAMDPRKRKRDAEQQVFQKRGSRSDLLEDFEGDGDNFDPQLDLMVTDSPAMGGARPPTSPPSSSDDSPPLSPQSGCMSPSMEECSTSNRKGVPQFRNLSGPNREAIRQKATSFLVSHWPVNKVSSLIQKEYNCRVSQRTLYNWKSQALCGKGVSLTDCPDSPEVSPSPSPSVSPKKQAPKSPPRMDNHIVKTEREASHSNCPPMVYAEFPHQGQIRGSCPSSPDFSDMSCPSSGTTSPDCAPLNNPPFLPHPCEENQSGEKMPYNSDLFCSYLDLMSPDCAPPPVSVKHEPMVHVKVEPLAHGMMHPVPHPTSVDDFIKRHGSFDLSFSCHNSSSLMLPPVSPVLMSFNMGPPPVAFAPPLCL